MSMVDYWRDLETGPQPPEVVYAVIENPKGTENKYEYDVDKKTIVLDRVLYSAMHYPGDYGFIPRTRDEDGDPLDILVLVTNPTFPGCILTVRPIALLRMIDGDKTDDKILAVPTADPRYERYKDAGDASQHILKEISHLFETYKTLEGRTTKVLGWENVETAKAAITRCQELYRREVT
jgi:inorganic pyrophosphatase